jgi:diaminopimelate decarboxylase
MVSVMNVATSTPTQVNLTSGQARELTATHGSPLYVYSQAALSSRADQLLGLDAPFGFTVRYAVKANPHPGIIQLFAARGVHFDASSSYEAQNLLDQGITGERISLSSQQPSHNLPDLHAAGVRFVATSLHQLELFAQAARPGAHLAVRLNTGTGAGHNRRTTTAGVAASFGLWYEYLPDALALARRHGLVIDRLHTHIGSGADPAVWESAIDASLKLVDQLPDVTTLDIGGGYKIHRYGAEPESDMAAIMAGFNARLEAYANRTGRRLHLEIEPGTWLVAHAGALIAEITDIVDTGKHGYTFLRTNTGMNDFLRPSLYGSQHQIRVLNDASAHADYVVVGHNCESGDILTPAPGNPEAIEPRRLNQANIGDLLVIQDAGAYCASMRATGYNAFPAAGEVLI